MSLLIKNTKDLITPENYKMKALLVALPGTGKSTWVGTVPNVGIAASETGHGSGLASIAGGNVDYVEPSSYKEFESFCSGDLFKEKNALAVDSLSAMSRTFIKDYALTFPRGKGDSLKRRAGCAELDDYGVMAELTRRLLAKLIGIDKHIIVTCTLKLPQAADPTEGREAQPGMPDLPGQLALAAAAMFDLVLIMRTRPALRDPKDARSRFTERYFLTQPSEGWVAKSRLNHAGKPILADEEIFDVPIVGQPTRGSFPEILAKIVNSYK